MGGVRPIQHGMSVAVQLVQGQSCRPPTPVIETVGSILGALCPATRADLIRTIMYVYL